MLRAVLCSLLVAVSLTAQAAPAVAIHVSCAAAVDAAHARTLQHALASRTLPAGVTLDVSVVRLSATTAGREVEIAAEVRGALSDASGRIRTTATVKAKARGPMRDRVLIERDVLDEAARQLAVNWERMSR